MRNKTVSLSANTRSNYTDDRLGIPEMDLENAFVVSDEGRFKSSACDLMEGCSHSMPIDTTFENTSEPVMNIVRSDMTRYAKTGAPRDVKLHKYPHRRF